MCRVPCREHHRDETRPIIGRSLNYVVLEDFDIEDCVQGVDQKTISFVKLKQLGRKEFLGTFKGKSKKEFESEIEKLWKEVNSGDPEAHFQLNTPPKKKPQIYPLTPESPHFKDERQRGSKRRLIYDIADTMIKNARYEGMIEIVKKMDAEIRYLKESVKSYKKSTETYKYQKTQALMRLFKAERAANHISSNTTYHDF